MVLGLPSLLSKWQATETPNGKKTPKEKEGCQQMPAQMSAHGTTGSASRYSKGQEGYKRWYGNHEHEKLSQLSTRRRLQSFMSSDGRYLKGHAGYSRWYGRKS